jgi:hypothetical protein
MDDNQARDRNLPMATDRCELDGRELDERLDEIGRLVRSALRERYDEEGRTTLVFEPTAASEVHDLVRRERDCCGHLEFRIEEDDDAVRLAIESRSNPSRH